MRDQIIKQVSSINITSLDDVSLATNAFKQVTKQTDEISAKSLVTYLNVCESLLITAAFLLLSLRSLLNILDLCCCSSAENFVKKVVYIASEVLLSG